MSELQEFDLVAMVQMLKERNEQLVRDITAERSVYERHIASIEAQLADLQPRADEQKTADQQRIKELEKSLRLKQTELRLMKLKHKKDLAKVFATRQQSQITVACEPHLL